MEPRSPILKVVALFVTVVAVAAGSVFADSVHIYGGSFALPIPDDTQTSEGWMADAIIVVPTHHIIHDIDVSISLTHSNVFDLQLFLQSPAGTRLCLNMYNFDEFFTGADYTQTVFDDEALIPIEQAEAPFTGRFRPRAGNLLEIFDGQDAYGLWRLQIYDAWDYDTGILNNAQLEITTPEPATIILLALGTALMCLFNPRRT